MSARRTLVLGLLAVLALPAASAAASDAVRISVLTVTPGPELFTGFGHTALRVRDGNTGQDQVYDYGTYDSSDPDLAGKFLVGELQYWLQVAPYPLAMRWYDADFAGVFEQELALTAAQVEEVVAHLAHDALPENRAYAYHHFRDNCTTRVRDILDSVYDGALARQTKGAPGDDDTYRSLIVRSLRDWPLVRWPVFGLLNGIIDLPLDRWARMFLPVYLMWELDRLEVTGPDGATRPAVAARESLSGGVPELPGQLPAPTAWLILVAGLLLGLGGPALLPFPRFARIWTSSWVALLALVAAAYGGIMVLAWAVAPYPETNGNWNLLATHPLLLVLVALAPLAACGRRRPTRWLMVALLVQAGICAVGLLLRALGLVGQHVEGFLVPVLIAALAAWGTLQRQARRRVASAPGS